MIELPEERVAKRARTVPSGCTIREASHLMEHPDCRGLLVVDTETQPIGVIRLADVRRSTLDGLSLNAQVDEIMSPIPVGMLDGRPRELEQIYRLLGLAEAGGRRRESAPQPLVVILAGGEGKRLRPLTSAVPKPLLPIGGHPLLEIMVRRLANSDLKDITVAIRYRGEAIEARFGSGEAFGVRLNYIREQSPLGTAGAIRLALAEDPRRALVINGDILTALHFDEMIEHHERRGNYCTVGVKLIEAAIPYGVLELDGVDVRAIKEKPVKRYFVNAGIYVLEPSAAELIPFNRRFDMTDVIATAIAKGFRVGAFPIVEYWQDIGQADDYKAANLAFAEHFSSLEGIEASQIDRKP